jgi:hypothetical protein
MLGLPPELELVAPPPVPVLPQTLVVGMHTSSCAPFAPEVIMQLRSDGHVEPLAQVGAQ